MVCPRQPHEGGRRRADVALRRGGRGEGGEFVGRGTDNCAALTSFGPVRGAADPPEKGSGLIFGTFWDGRDGGLAVH